MLINDTKVELSAEERQLIEKFFDVNKEYMKNTDLHNYENLKVFGDMYQKFLEENNQTKNDKLLLFLAEIRHNQLSLKINKDSLYLKIVRLAKNKIPNFIRKWMFESKILYKAEMSIENQKALQLQLEQNARERSASFKEASKKIVK